MQPIAALSLIVAATYTHDVIGSGDKLPSWTLPGDMRHFVDTTTGHPVIMGRKTWESIPLKFRPLPNRDNIVVTQRKGYGAEGAFVVNSLEDALEKAVGCPGAGEIFVIGGEEIYRLFLPLVSRVYVTIIYDEGDPILGDKHFSVANLKKHGLTLREISSPRRLHEGDSHFTAFARFERLVG